MFITKYIPNTITLLNLLSGCMAIVCASHPLEIWNDIPAYRLGFIFILMAATADFFDGLSARMLGRYSDLGKQLDSLSDLVSFGVAPAMLLFHMMQESGAPFAACLSTLLIPLFGALRLGRFNIDTTQSDTFSGLPIPAAALFSVGLASIIASDTGAGLYGVVGCNIAIALLMVAPVRMYSFKIKRLTASTLFLPISLAAISVICICLMGWTGLFYAVAYYVLSSFVASFVHTVRRQ